MQIDPDVFPYLPEEPHNEDEEFASVYSFIARSILIRPNRGFTVIQPTRPVSVEYAARAPHARNPLGAGF